MHFEVRLSSLQRSSEELPLDGRENSRKYLYINKDTNFDAIFKASGVTLGYPNIKFTNKVFEAFFTKYYLDECLAYPFVHIYLYRIWQLQPLLPKIQRILGHILCPVVTLVTFSINLSNFEQNKKSKNIQRKYKKKNKKIKKLNLSK